jgi:hypothetical protein
MDAMDEYPHMLPSSNRAARDRIEAAINDLTWSERHDLRTDGEHQRRTAAGILRKAFMPELARMKETQSTLDRVRRVVRQYPETGDVPVRRLLAALYGEERP